MYQDERRLDFHALGREIKRKREAKGWTQECLAQLVARTPRSIMYIENRGQHPSLNTFYQLVTLLEISVDQFFYPANESSESDCRKHIDVLLNSMDEREFNYALRVGVSATFLLTKLFMPCFATGASIINISSSRDRMSQPQSESYTAAKGGISALTHALAVSLAGKVRVNSISPGWIDTNYTVYDGADAMQQPVGRVGNPLDIANMVLFLCSEKAGFITGENICIDSGQSRLMIYHNDCGWTYKP
jgi:NAD(P)-dependent dehydrogenase (short-subunit alcohol dehydrogenase family)